MAKVLGESGRYASQEEIKKFRQLYLVVILVMCVLGTIQGFVLSISFIVQKHHLFASTLIELILLGAICLVGRIGFRELNKIEKERMAMRKGAAGENIVAQILKDFPEDFCVINGLTTPFGEPLMVNEIAERIKKKPSLVSKHLAVLRKAGLVQIGHAHLYQIPKHFTVAPDKRHLDFGHCLLRLPATRE